jgi:hypothetical protein
MSPESRAKFLENEQTKARFRARYLQDRRDETDYGPLNPVMFCPHCRVTGKIRTKEVTNKKGVSGGKATAALLTGGVSLLAVGLSRKEVGIQARCGNCSKYWII